MIHDLTLPSSKVRVVPLLVPLGTMQRLPVMSRIGNSSPRGDLVTQYASQRKAYAAKTATSANGIEVKLDTARCYWPGQPVETLIHIPKSILDTCTELRFELKGIVNTHTFRSTGQSTNVQVWSEALFLHAVSIDLGDDGQPIKTFSNHPTTLVDQLPPSANHNGGVEWACTFGIPERGQIVANGSKDGPRKMVPLPPTFRDDATALSPGPSGASTYVAYLVKVTAFVKGKLRTNARVWMPILLLPFAQAPPLLSMSIPPAYGPQSAELATPEGWVRCLTEVKLKKLVLFEQGALEVEVALPRPVNIPFGTRVPFIMRIRAYAGSRKDIENGGAVPLPELPLTGAGEKHPVFLVRRLEHCSASGRFGMTVSGIPAHAVATRFRYINLPCDVEWGSGHLPGRHEDPINAAATDGDWSALMALGHGWTEAHEVYDDNDSSASSSVNPKGKAKAKKRWQREACVTGTVLPWIPPPVSLPKLVVSYTLGITWTLKGLGNGIKAELINWEASSGMSSNLAEKLSVEEISRRVAGDKYALLTGGRELEEEGGDEETGLDEEDADDDECPPEYEHPPQLQPAEKA